MSQFRSPRLSIPTAHDFHVNESSFPQAKLDSELMFHTFYLSSFSFQMTMVTWDVGRTLEVFVNHSPAARGLRILLVFYQHPA